MRRIIALKLQGAAEVGEIRPPIFSGAFHAPIKSAGDKRR